MEMTDNNGEVKKSVSLSKTNYVEIAEERIKGLDKDSKGVILIKTNKIRNILSLMNELYAMIKRDRNEKLSVETQSHVQYVRMKLAYEAGRDANVKKFLKDVRLIGYLKIVKDSRAKLLLICNYTEALVAYHKYYTNEK